MKAIYTRNEIIDEAIKALDNPETEMVNVIEDVVQMNMVFNSKNVAVKRLNQYGTKVETQQRAHEVDVWVNGYATIDLNNPVDVADTISVAEIASFFAIDLKELNPILMEPITPAIKQQVISLLESKRTK